MPVQTPQRVLALDAFRGVTILLMIFVNALAGVRGVPAWLEYAPAGIDGMTVVYALTQYCHLAPPDTLNAGVPGMLAALAYACAVVAAIPILNHMRITLRL